jgi:hypothetical protein
VVLKEFGREPARGPRLGTLEKPLAQAPAGVERLGRLFREGPWLRRLRPGEVGRAKPVQPVEQCERRPAVLGVIHDLGKTLTYQPSGTGWTSHPASPHDSLSARLLGQLLAFRRAFPDPVRHALLQALRDYHSPEAFATNAPPLATQLLQWLQEADTEAIEQATDRARETRPA